MKNQARHEAIGFGFAEYFNQRFIGVRFKLSKTTSVRSAVGWSSSPK
jgi:hypothetical protein